MLTLQRKLQLDQLILQWLDVSDMGSPWSQLNWTTGHGEHIPTENTKGQFFSAAGNFFAKSELSSYMWLSRCATRIQDAEFVIPNHVLSRIAGRNAEWPVSMCLLRRRSPAELDAGFLDNLFLISHAYNRYWAALAKMGCPTSFPSISVSRAPNAQARDGGGCTLLRAIIWPVQNNVRLEANP
jgi:hypothetical protein